MERKTGIVLVPMIFGVSIATRLTAWFFRRAGYAVKIADFYRNQRHQRRFWISILRRGEQGLCEQTNRLSDAAAFQSIYDAVRDLRQAGCTQVILVGESLGGTYALEAANVLDAPVVAISPLLIMPKSVTRKSPDIRRLNRSQALVLYAGAEQFDTSFLPSIRFAQRSLPTEFFGTSATPHAAQSLFVQGWWPSIKFRLRAARTCWQRVLTFVKAQ